MRSVLEQLLQEQIYDEQDKVERRSHALAQRVVRQWKNFVVKRKIGAATNSRQPAMIPVVQRAVAAAKKVSREDDIGAGVEEGAAATTVTTETTALLADISKGT